MPFGSRHAQLFPPWPAQLTVFLLGWVEQGWRYLTGCGLAESLPCPSVSGIKEQTKQAALRAPSRLAPGLNSAWPQLRISVRGLSFPEIRR